MWWRNSGVFAQKVHKIPLSGKPWNRAPQRVLWQLTAAHRLKLSGGRARLLNFRLRITLVEPDGFYPTIAQNRDVKNGREEPTISAKLGVSESPNGFPCANKLNV